MTAADGQPAPGAQRSWAALAAAAPTVLLGLFNGLYTAALHAYSPTAYWFADFCQWVAVPLISLVWLLHAGGYRPRDYGMAIPGRGRILRTVAATAWSVLLLGAVYLVGKQLLASFIGADQPSFTYSHALPGDGWHLTMVLYLALSAGFVEEIVYRALPWLFLRSVGWKPARRTLYVLVSSAVFAAIHWENGAAEVGAAFAYGLCASLLYTRLRNLWPLIGAHILIDIVDFW